MKGNTMKNKWRKVLAMAVLSAVAVTGLAGCGGGKEDEVADTAISVISREDGSGTRGAFVELLGVEQPKEMTGKSLIKK